MFYIVYQTQTSSFSQWLHNTCVLWTCCVLQGSELSGWALGRYSYEGIDMNHNFADLNTVMWDAIELEMDKSKLINHYFPIPEHYTSEDAMVWGLAD